MTAQTANWHLAAAVGGVNFALVDLLTAVESRTPPGRRIAFDPELLTELNQLLLSGSIDEIDDLPIRVSLAAAVHHAAEIGHLAVVYCNREIVRGACSAELVFA